LRGVHDFSLFAGGLLYRIALRLGLMRGESTLPRLGVALGLLTWTPLAVLAALTAVSGLAHSRVAVPFFSDLGTHVRLLVAIPLFFAAEAWVGPRLGGFLGQMVESRLVLPEDMPALDAAVSGAMRLRDSLTAEVALVVVTIVTISTGVRLDLPGDASTWRTTGGVLTWAGFWYAAVSRPIFQFLCWRWLWRLVIWTTLLWRLSKLNLQLVSTHPDLAGGLGYLGVAHSYFGTLGFAASAVLSASFSEQVLFAGQQPQSFLTLIGAIVLINLLVFLGPLLCFTPRLLEVKRRGLREYGIVAAAYTHLFEEKWVRRREETVESLLGADDIQSLADMANSFAIVRSMHLAPFGLPLILWLALSAVAPMVPLLFFRFSPEELLLQLAKALFGV
jgi:hypothetical protein